MYSRRNTSTETLATIGALLQFILAIVVIVFWVWLFFWKIIPCMDKYLAS